MATERKDFGGTGGNGVSLLRYPPDDHTCNMAMGINKLVGKGRPFRSPVLGGVGL